MRHQHHLCGEHDFTWLFARPLVHRSAGFPRGFEKSDGRVESSTCCLNWDRRRVHKTASEKNIPRLRNFLGVIGGPFGPVGIWDSHPFARFRSPPFPCFSGIDPMVRRCIPTCKLPCTHYQRSQKGADRSSSVPATVRTNALLKPRFSSDEFPRRRSPSSFGTQFGSHLSN